MEKYLVEIDGITYECELKLRENRVGDWDLYCETLQSKPIANIYQQTLICNQHTRLDGYMYRVCNLENSEQTQMGKAILIYAIECSLQLFLNKLKSSKLCE